MEYMDNAKHHTLKKYWQKKYAIIWHTNARCHISYMNVLSWEELNAAALTEEILI